MLKSIWGRCCDRQGAVVPGAGKGELIGMKRQPAHGVGGGVVLLISGHRMAQLGKMDSDLIFSAGVQGYVQKGIAFLLGEHMIVGDRFSALTVAGGVDPVSALFHQIRAANPLLRKVTAFYHGPITPLTY